MSESILASLPLWGFLGLYQKMCVLRCRWRNTKALQQCTCRCQWQPSRFRFLARVQSKTRRYQFEVSTEQRVVRLAGGSARRWSWRGVQDGWTSRRNDAKDSVQVRHEGIRRTRSAGRTERVNVRLLQTRQPAQALEKPLRDNLWQLPTLCSGHISSLCRLVPTAWYIANSKRI